MCRILLRKHGAIWAQKSEPRLSPRQLLRIREWCSFGGTNLGFENRMVDVGPRIFCKKICHWNWLNFPWFHALHLASSSPFLFIILSWCLHLLSARRGWFLTLSEPALEQMMPIPQSLFLQTWVVTRKKISHLAAFGCTFIAFYSQGILCMAWITSLENKRKHSWKRKSFLGISIVLMQAPWSRVYTFLFLFSFWVGRLPPEFVWNLKFLKVFSVECVISVCIKERCCKSKCALG